MTWRTEVRVEELEWPTQSPYLNLTEHLWDEQERQLHPRPPHLTSGLDLSNALVAEWAQIPTAIFQNWVETFPRQEKVIITGKGGLNLE